MANFDFLSAGCVVNTQPQEETPVLLVNAHNILYPPDTSADLFYNMPLGVDGDFISVMLGTTMEPGKKVDVGVGFIEDPWFRKAGDSVLCKWSDDLAGWCTIVLVQK